MNCQKEFRIFRGRKVSHLPRDCDVCFVLCTEDCTLYRKKSGCKHKNCNSCGSSKWTPVKICEPFIFFDVCKELVIPVNFNLGGLGCGSGCSGSCGGSCITSHNTGCVISCSSVDPTGAIGTTSGECTFMTNPGTAMRGISDNGLAIAELSVCSGGSNPTYVGSITGCASQLFVIAPPPGLQEDQDFTDVGTDTPCLTDPLDSANIDGVNTMIFLVGDGSFRAGRFRAEDLIFPIISFDDDDNQIPSATAAFGSFTRASGRNSFAMGLNSDAYLDGSMAHSSCLIEPPVRAGPPTQPATPDKGQCQYLRFLMTGITKCLTAECLCDLNENTCQNIDDIGCEQDNLPPPCLPTVKMNDTREPIDCPPDIPDQRYAVTNFIVCSTPIENLVDPTACEIDADLCPYLPYTGTAFGTIDIVQPRLVGCNAAAITCSDDQDPSTCFGCPLGQRWCFAITRIQTDNEITHIANFLEPVCGNNSLTGDPADDRYTLCISQTDCDSDGVVRFCFRLIRNTPIGTIPGDDIAPEYCATVKMTMVASGICEKICEIPEEADDCFICCPIPVSVPDECRPQCTDCTVTCGSTTSTTSTTSTASTSSSLRTPFSMPRSTRTRATTRGLPRSTRSVTKKPCKGCGSKGGDTQVKAKED